MHQKERGFGSGFMPIFSEMSEVRVEVRSLRKAANYLSNP